MQAACAAALILARGGSKGVPGKNLRAVGGVPLVARSIRAAKAAGTISDVWVSTDDMAIAATARAEGAQVINRPAEISGDTASSEAGWLHALPIIRAALPNLSDLVFLQCTSPFTSGADIDSVLTKMRQRGADCALSVVPNHGFLWHESSDGFGRGTNHDADIQRPRRQDLAPSWLENGAVYAVNAARFETVGRRFCGKVALVAVDHPPLEIDSTADLELAKFLAASSHAALPSPERLARIRALVMDFDGVHSDDLVRTDQNGVESVNCSRSDGLGLGMLRQAGRHRLLILSKETNPVVQARAAKLQIEALSAIDDKPTALDQWLIREGIAWSEVLYVGNDLNDAAVMARAGLSACPSDAWPAIRAQADWILPAPGGRGALRAVCEVLLATGQSQ